MKSPTKRQMVSTLKAQVKKLEAELGEVKRATGDDPYITVKVAKAQVRFTRVKNPKGADKGIGEYLVDVDITSRKDTVFVPISIASGKKATGFVYQIEGTAAGAISTARVTAKGEGVTQVTSGTIIYAKIPASKKATFRIQAQIRGKIGKTYTIVINRINYKLTLRDARYQQYLKEVSTKSLNFS